MPFASNQKLNFIPFVDPGLRQFASLLVFAVGMSGLWLAACTYGVIPALSELAKAKWADVQAQYQSRANLTANLLASPAALPSQENETLSALAQARTHASSATIDASQTTNSAKMLQFEQAQVQLSGALSRLLAIGEKYPDPKSQQNLQVLRAQLEATDKRIATARSGYADASRRFNIALEVLPTLVWAKTLFRGMQPFAEFTIDDPAAPTAQH